MRMATEEQREQRLRLLDDHIGRSLAAAEASGELQTARSFGKPLDLGDGYDETPAELRMPFKLLKDSGFLPPEVTLMREIATLRQALAQDDAAGRALSEADAHRQRLRLADLEQRLALRMEGLSRGRRL
jgi:Domain of unknown function (DUF1992)